MQPLTRNPIQRQLPDGWIEHFDSQYVVISVDCFFAINNYLGEIYGQWNSIPQILYEFNIFHRYYVDLNSDPPRVTLVHPSELNGKHPSSAPARVKDHGHQPPRGSPVQRPIGPRQSASTSSNSIPHPSRRPRRATVAQQLYASSLTVGPKDSLLATTISETSSRTPSHCGSGSATPVSDNIVSSPSSPTGYPSSSSASSSTRVSPTSLAAPSPSMDVHNPRNFLDYTRLVGTRRVTYSGPQPFIGPRSSGKTLASGSAGSHNKVAFEADAFYPGPVKTSLSSSVLLKSTSLDPPDNHLHLTALSAPNSHQMKAAVNSDELPSSSDSSTVCPHSLITAPINVAQSMATSIEPLTPTTDETLKGKRSRREDSYSSRKPSSILNESDPSTSSTSIRPLPPTTKPPSRNNSSLASEAILQPKPMRPLAGVSLNLQVQVSGVKSESSPDHLGAHQDFVSKKKKGPLLQNLSLSLSKNAKGKTPIRTIYDRQLLSSSPVLDDFAL